MLMIGHVSQKCGLGRKLYETLEVKLQEMGILNLYACIAYPPHEDKCLNKSSAEFHSHMGFVKVGKIHQCGYKFGHWLFHLFYAFVCFIVRVIYFLFLCDEIISLIVSDV